MRVLSCRTASPPNGRRTRASGPPGRPPPTSGWTILRPRGRRSARSSGRSTTAAAGKSSRFLRPPRAPWLMRKRRWGEPARACTTRPPRTSDTATPDPSDCGGRGGARREGTGAVAEAALRCPRARVHHAPFGTCWLRDTGPIFVRGEGGLTAVDFGFNGWGGKYDLPNDDTVAASISRLTHTPLRSSDWIFEGGAIDVDGTGLAVTTEQCLLNPNRNPGMSKGEIEARLSDDLGVERLLWLGDGLLNDHTDGHVDNLARFAAPGALLLPRSEEHTAEL